MDIRQLKYFLAIVEEEQITKAAKRLHMTQPPLTQQLQLMERELGTPLFDHIGRKLVLTRAGQILKERAESIIHLLDATEDELKGLVEGIRGTLSIGSIASWGKHLLPHWMQVFHAKYPDVHFRITEGNLRYIFQLFEERSIDIGIVRLPLDQNKYEWISLPNDRSFVAAHQNWMQQIPGDTVHIKDLKDKPLILLREELKTTDNFTAIVNACQEEGFEPTIFCECADIHTALKVTEAGLGFTIIPNTAISLISGGSVQVKGLANLTFESTAAIAWRKDLHLTTISKHFIDSFSEIDLKILSKLTQID